MNSSATQKILEESYLEVQTIDDVPLETVKAIIDENGFIRISGLIHMDAVESSILKLKENFSRKNDHPATGESTDDVKTNFQKLSVGNVHSKHHSHNYSRFLRTFYNPLWEKDIYGIHDIFSELVILRNRLLRKPDNFARDRIEEGLWTAARIHQYPAGGGYMGEHTDKTLGGFLEGIKLNYYQVLLVMSKKGKDFQDGGAFIRNKGDKIVIENQANPGDIIIYDGRSLHGVDDIDPQKNLELDKICGRLAAFVSLYKNL